MDIEGRKRWYFYVWQNFLAVDPHFGIASKEQAYRIMVAYDSNIARIGRETNRSAEQMWCTPSNLRSVAPEDAMVSIRGDQADFGSYENGACFFAMSGLELAARGFAGDPSGALRRFRELMAVFDKTRFWGQHAEWVGHPTKSLRAAARTTDSDLILDGADVLTDSLILLWGFIRGAFGIHVSLLDGVVPLPRGPAPELEGANYTFVVHGKPVLLRVRGGKTLVGPDTSYLPFEMFV